MDRGMKRTTGTIRPIRAACVVLCISIGGALLTGTAWAQVDKAQAPEELTPLVKEQPKVLPMLCGTKTFVRPLRAYFTEAGYDRKEVKVETYD